MGPFSLVKVACLYAISGLDKINQRLGCDLFGGCLLFYLHICDSAALSSQISVVLILSISTTFYPRPIESFEFFFFFFFCKLTKLINILPNKYRHHFSFSFLCKPTKRVDECRKNWKVKYVLLTSSSQLATSKEIPLVRFFLLDLWKLWSANFLSLYLYRSFCRRKKEKEIIRFYPSSVHFVCDLSLSLPISIAFVLPRFTPYARTLERYSLYENFSPSVELQNKIC